MRVPSSPAKKAKLKQVENLRSRVHGGEICIDPLHNRNVKRASPKPCNDPLWWTLGENPRRP